MIVLSDSGTASSTRILQEVPSLERKVTHRDAQTFLANLCRDKWLKQEVGCWQSLLAFINPPILTPLFLSPSSSLTFPVGCPLPRASFCPGVEAISPGALWRWCISLSPLQGPCYSGLSISLSSTPLLTKILYFLSQGQKCSCGTKLHLYCAAKLFNARCVKTDCLPPFYHLAPCVIHLPCP